MHIERAEAVSWPKRFVRYKTGAMLIGVSPKKFERMSYEVHLYYKTCIYKVDRTVWVDMPVIIEYIRLFPLSM